jgi:hypothetical protein
MGEGGFGAISPSYDLGCPVVVIVIDVCPFVLPLGIFFIQATSHVNSILFELFVSELFGFGG